MNILFIDTSSNKEIKVGLKVGVKIYRIKKPITYQKAQVVLPMIDKLLQKHKLALKDLSKIEVNRGPGSFTGLRVGIAVANSLGWVLGIPVNGKKPVTEALYREKYL